MWDLIEAMELRSRQNDMHSEAIYFRVCYDRVARLKKAGFLSRNSDVGVKLMLLFHRER